MRRNRIKAVINVPRGARTTDRPLTPITSSHHDPSSHLFPARSQSPLALPSSPTKGRPNTPSLPSHSEHFSLVSLNSPNIPPISPGGIQRPAPTPSPGSAVVGSFRLNLIHSPKRPSPSPSPGRSTFFNCNSNSADSHEVAKFMSPTLTASSPSSSLVRMEDARHTPTPTGQGAFSSVRDPGVALVNTATTSVLRQRLEKPVKDLTTSKYQTLRKEFTAKGNQINQREKKGLTMLHFAFLNPLIDKKPEIIDSCSDKDEDDVGSHVSVTCITPCKLEKNLKSTSQEEKPAATPVKDNSAKSSKSPGPRVKVGPDGQLIIDEKSLLVETSENQRAKNRLEEMETVSGADFIVGSSGLYKNKKKSHRGQDWSERETIKFYKALSMCGSDFSMMTKLFSNRTRTELKAKFKREDKKNPAQISLALSCQEFDVEGMTETESEPDSEENDEEFEIDELEAPIKKIKRKRKKKPLTQAERRRKKMKGSTSASPRKEEAENIVKSKQLGRPRRSVVGGRPTAAWKSKVVIDDATGEVLNQKDRELIETEDPDNPCTPPPKKRWTRKLKRRKVNDVPPEDDSDQAPEDPFENIDILRFDDSDPLGNNLLPLRVKAITLSSSEGKAPDLVNSVSSFTPCRRITRSVSAAAAAEELEMTKKKKLLPPNIKVLPFRVPGPGGPPIIPSSSKKPKPLVEEMEIEIICQ